MCLNEWGTDMRREQCFQELFVNSQMLSMTHWVNLIAEKKCWCEAKHTKHVSPLHLISTVAMVWQKGGICLFAMRWFWSLVWARYSLVQECFLGSWQPTAACHRADTLVQLEQSLQLSGTPHLCCWHHPRSDRRPQAHVQQTASPTFWQSCEKDLEPNKRLVFQSIKAMTRRERERNEKSGVF